MSRNERLNQILELVAKTGALDVEAAADALKVSVATVRRDFDHLSQSQLVDRTHGGIRATANAFDLPLRYKTAKSQSGKLRIAKYATELVSKGAVIGINGGTTTTEIARALSSAKKLVSKDGSITLTVVTNAINIATEMVIRPNVKIVVTGGVARPHSYELIGEYAAGILEGLVIDVAFLGVNGVDPVIGATANHEGEARIDQLLAEAAKEVYVVTTADKIGTTAFARILRPEGIKAIITDAPIDPEMQKRFNDQGVEIIVCD